MKIKTTTLSKALAAAMLSATLVIGSGSFTQTAHAQIPVTDVAGLMQAIQNGIMRAKDSQIMQMFEQTKMKLMSLYSELEIDALNNAVGNMIVRTGKAMQDLQNMDQLEKSMPAQDICDTIDMSVKLEDMICNMESQAFRDNQRNADSKAMSAGKKSMECTAGVCKMVDRAPTVEELTSFNARVAKKLITECEVLAKATGEDVCASTGLLVNPPPQAATTEQYKAMKNQIDLAVNPIIPMPQTDASMEGIRGTAAHYRSLAVDQRATNFRESLRSVLNHNMMLQHGTMEEDGTRQLGEVFLLDKFLGDRVGNQQWLCEIANACPGGDKAPHVAPAELERRKTQMDAVQMYIAVQQYKSTLRIEKILADIGLMQLDHPMR